jgi:23S rRNA pseudouridine955/2504/2580 synthase
MREKTTQTKSVQHLTIEAGDEGQRLDNFCIKHLKNIPKTHIYKIIRKGEVRVNKCRKPASYKLLAGDELRLPPVHGLLEKPKLSLKESTGEFLKQRIIFENEALLVLNKPSGMAVHGGSTVRVGIIEALKHFYPQYPQLELAHRLDTETSGCLLIAKKRSVLREIHTLLREGKVKKVYWALTQGVWQPKEYRVALPLDKHFVAGGKHVVRVRAEGKEALSVFKPLKIYPGVSLMEVRLHTGRTHQIRVHASSMGHGIAGDDRYGEKEFNQKMRKLGLKRLFLHASRVEFTLPTNSQHIRVEARLDNDLEKILQILSKE